MFTAYSTIEELPSQVSSGGEGILKDSEGHWITKGSRFHILINTNHVFKDEQEIKRCMSAMREATVNLAPPSTDMEAWDMLKFFEWEKDSSRTRTFQTFYELIEKVNIIFVFELGPSNGFLHEHIDMTIYHRSCIQLDKDSVYNYFMSKLRGAGIDLKSIFLRVKHQRACMTELYLTKGRLRAALKQSSKLLADEVDVNYSEVKDVMSSEESVVYEVGKGVQS